ncbi:unnamed protein product [Psylliodes chrysocephalus]|uniref:Uncharacterized protein n=1 Tax=Psylliodes chrysocephalus TaxID=3402493 RepID=A0A9P0CK06_9CUCU|nr:unnamed protein product [Psylliodes chrysocephala]
MAKKLSNSYEIRKVSGVNPRFRLVAMFEKGGLINLIQKGNPEVFVEDAECNIVNVITTKKNDAIFQAVIETDKITHKKNRPALKQKPPPLAPDSICIRVADGIETLLNHRYKLGNDIFGEELSVAD